MGKYGLRNTFESSYLVFQFLVLTAQAFVVHALSTCYSLSVYTICETRLVYIDRLDPVQRLDQQSRNLGLGHDRNWSVVDIQMIVFYQLVSSTLMPSRSMQVS